MSEKVGSKKVVSFNDTETNWMYRRSRKEDSVTTKRTAEMESPASASKRLKLSDEKNVKAPEVHLFENEQTMSDNKEEMSGNIKTRTRCRRKLTVENMKTILRYVLADKSILAMVQNTMKLQNEKKSYPAAEDQMKPSVAKECPKLPWPVLTPQKHEVSKKLLEEEYPEESASDEDYEPNEEELSDNDAASSVKTGDLNSSKFDDEILPDLKSPNQLSDDEGALVIALPETQVCPDKEVDKISQRTRSKLCLNDTPLEAIESSFQPPDITMDMYDTFCDDADWKDFLCEFTKPLDQALGTENVTDDTEDERDPEYKIQEGDEEEEDEDVLDYDEICGEDSLGVTGDEVNALMTEILEFAQQDQSLLDQDFSFLEELSLTFTENVKNASDLEKTESKNISEEKNKDNSSEEKSSTNLETDTNLKDPERRQSTNSSVEEANKSPSEDVSNLAAVPSIPIHIENVRKEWMILDERRQLDEQMRMYVQILTQSYLLSHGYPSLHFINTSSKLFLNEIKAFASRPTLNNQISAFYAHNLDDALDIVNKFDSQAETMQNQSKKLNKTIPHNIKRTLASNKVFIYPELLPKCGFYTLYRPSKASFSHAEDNLIALGLEQFSYMDEPVEFIQQFLLPTKAKHQIKGHIKTVKLKNLENPIAFYCKHKKLADFNRVIRIFNPDNVLAPEDFPLSVLPAWMESYSKINAVKKAVEKTAYSSEKKPKLILPRPQVFPTIIQKIEPEDSQEVMQPVISRMFSKINFLK